MDKRKIFNGWIILVVLLTSLLANGVQSARAGSPAPPAGRSAAPSDDASGTPITSFDDLPLGLAPALARTLADELPADYHVRATEGGYRAANAAHDLMTTFGPGGPHVTLADETWRLTLRGLGRADDVHEIAASPQVTADGPRLEYHYAGPVGLVEWYLNTNWGLEQGFTLAARPAGQGELVLDLAMSGSLRARPDGATALRLVDATGRTVARYTGLHAYDAEGRALPARLELRGRRVAIVVDDAGAAYPITIDPWIQQAKLQPGHRASDHRFGRSVAVSGDTVVVGASYDDDNGERSGSVYVFQKPVGGWRDGVQTAKLLPDDGTTDDLFGRSVAISGDTVVVGAHGDDDNGDNAGSVYIFEKPMNGWSGTVYQTAKLLPSDGIVWQFFGFSVAISGDTVVIGARNDNVYGQNSGSAYIFEKGGGWADGSANQRAKLLPDDGAVDDLFGVSVSISGDTVVVGAYLDDDNGEWSGSAYVFEEPVGGWSGTLYQSAKLLPDDGMAYDVFGWGVAISGDTVVVGACHDDDNGGNSGSVYVFEKPGGGWSGTLSQTAKLLPDDGESGDDFGAVAISGDTVVVGAGDDDDNGSDAGSIYVFEKGSGWANGSANQVGKLLPDDGMADDHFGRSVAISGDTVVGAPGDDDTEDWSGAAYVFQEPTGGWGDMTQTAKLLPDDSFTGDHFGYFVAIDGTTVVVGAYADGPGAVYIFENPRGDGSGTLGTLHQTAKLLPDDGAAGDRFGQSVAISGETVVVGAYYDDDNGSNSGAVYIFEKGSGWADGSANQVAKLLPDDGAAGDYFGHYVAISGNTVVIAAKNDDDNGGDSGSIYIFEKGGGWVDGSANQTAKLLPDDGAAGDRFGRSVAISGDTVVAGTRWDDDNGSASGSAYIFEKGSGWANGAVNQVAKLLPNDGAAGDHFGWSVDISVDTVVVGAYQDDDNGSNSGSAYVFEKPISGWSNITQTAKLLPDDGASTDWFGAVVAISGDTIVVGAYLDDDNGNDAGSVYVFGEPQNGWSDMTQTAKLLPADVTTHDWFGHFVAIGGDTIVAGADGDDDNGSASGSAYVFERASAFDHLALYALAFDNPLTTPYSLAPYYAETMAGIQRATATFSTTAIVLADLEEAGDTHIKVMQNGEVIETITDLPDASGTLADLHEYDMTSGTDLGGFLQWALNSPYNVADSQVTFSYIGHGSAVVPNDDLSSLVLGGPMQMNAPTASSALPLPSYVGAHPSFTDHHPQHGLISPGALAEALDAATDGGQDPLAVVDLVHCFAASLEALYELAPYADTLTGSPNYTYFAPDMPGQAMGPAALSQDMAVNIIDTYSNALPATEHPHLLVAVDSGQLAGIGESWNEVAYYLLAGFDSGKLLSAYQNSSKYDTTFCDPQDWELGCPDALVDLADFAEALSQEFGPLSEVGIHANTTAERVEAAIIARRSANGRPWFADVSPKPTWTFDNAMGLGLYADLEGMRFDQDPGVPYLSWQSRWYTGTNYALTADTLWDEVFNHYWEGQTVKTAFCLPYLPPARQPGDLGIERIVFPLEGSVTQGTPVQIAVAITTTRVALNPQVQFTVTLNGSVVFTDIVGSGYLVTGTHQVDASRTWTPDATGDYELTVTVNGDGRIMGDDPQNNTLTLSDRVWPSGQPRPIIEAHVSGNLQWVTDATVHLDITQDAATTPPEVGRLSIQVYQYPLGAYKPILVDTQMFNSVTLPLSDWAVALPLTAPGPVVLHIWGWSTGGLSAAPAIVEFNYAPPDTSISAGASHGYRFQANQGDDVHIALHVPAGQDANVFVWDPLSHGLPTWQSTVVGSDALTFTATFSGQYTLSVYGETDAEYTLNVRRNGALGQTLVAPQSLGTDDPQASVPQSRPIFVEPIPQQPAPDASDKGRKIFLPFTLR